MTVDFDSTPYFEKRTGRWMCSNTSDAMGMVEHHPGDYVFTYERDKDGNQVNIIPFWTPNMPDTRKIKGVKHGRVVWRS